MKGLLLKDFYLLRGYGKMLLVLMLLFAVVFLPTTGAGFAGVCVLLFAFSVVTTMSYDKQCNWERYALSTPLSRQKLVASKYILLVILCLFGVALSFLLCTVGGIILKNLNLPELLPTCIALFSIGMLMGAVILPLIYRFGVEKARMLLIVCCFLPTLLVTFAAQWIAKLGIPMPDARLMDALLYSLPVFSLLVLYISYLISLKIFQKKEF